MTIYAGTGHRPNKIGGYTPEAVNLLNMFAEEILKNVLPTPTKIISGMALGWDQALARAAVVLDIPFIAAVPFNGQESAWPYTSRLYYKNLLAKASKIHVVCPGGYSAWKMQERNKWMVDNCNILLALWDGSTGGTKNCVDYAQSMYKPIEPLWSRWEIFRCAQLSLLQSSTPSSSAS